MAVAELAAGVASAQTAVPPSSPPVSASGPAPTGVAGEAPRQNKAAPPTAVSGLTVTLTRRTPEVASTFPAEGAVVAPGVLVLRVTFNQPMYGDSWSYVTSPEGSYPDCAAAPRRLDDRKSFALICRTTPKAHYVLWLNRAPYSNFVNLGRKAATPYLLSFSTSDADPTWTLADAMKLDPALPAGSNPAEPLGKRRPGEEVDVDGSPAPVAPTDAAAKPQRPS